MSLKVLSVPIQMKATEQYFSAVLFIILYKVVLTLDCMDEILTLQMKDTSNASSWSRPAVHFVNEIPLY